MPHVSQLWRRPTFSRGSTKATRPRPASRCPTSPPRKRRPGPTASALGASPPIASRRCARRSTFTIYTPGSNAGVALEHRRIVAGPVRRQRRRGRRRRDRRLRQWVAEPRRHRCRPAVEPRAHPAVQPDPQRVDRGTQPRPADAGRHDPAAADPQARRVRARPVLPAEGPHGVRNPAQRLAGVAVVRRVDDRPAARHRRRC